MKLNRKYALLLSVGGVLALAGGSAFVLGVVRAPATDAATASPQSQGPPPAPVVLSTAVSTNLAPTAEAPGSIVSVNDSLVAAATAGKVEWVAQVGAEVEIGDTIARIDPANATYARDEARAEQSRLSARANYLTRLLERYESLGEEAGESEASLDQMRSDRDEAEQNLARATVAAQRAETELSRTLVKAPFAGRIATREIQVGEYATPGSPIARLVDTHNLEVTAQAPAALMSNISVGDEIAVSYGGNQLTAPVRAIVPVGNEISRTLEIRLALPETDWHIGSAVRVSIPSSLPRKVIAANRDALVLRANRISVFVVDADKVAKQVDVELGAADGDIIEIIGEVSEGDQLVIRGAERLRNGQIVDPKPIENKSPVS